MPDELGTALTALATAAILALAALLNRWVQAYRKGHPTVEKEKGNGLKRLQEAQGWEKAYRELREHHLALEARVDALKANYDSLVAAVKEEEYKDANRIFRRAKEIRDEDR